MHLISSNSTVGPPTDRLQLFAEWSNTTDVRVTAAGDVDMSTARYFTDFVFRRAGNCRRLTLDMTQVTFFDCAGISALECIEERCREAHVVLEIEPAQCVSRVMTLCQSLCA
ncbi:STAS domain-containing protein [Mycolicibacterium rhodesiae]|uniref:STAS domain-containing protein n=1 Tax=Mycolicibacterium rhodesiae TaxID=36814 RepID=UPI0009F68A1C|nr:STAS domain-containing protein [Mycolicibacterium rhodesiae]MCV7347792.1 STAS domain-containing protein [Mycolicibacterium rhodesiae]